MRCCRVAGLPGCRVVGLRVAGCGLRVAGCGLRVAGCGLRVAGCGLRVAGCGLRVERCERSVICISVWHCRNKPATIRGPTNNVERTTNQLRVERCDKSVVCISVWHRKETCDDPAYSIALSVSFVPYPIIYHARDKLPKTLYFDYAQYTLMYTTGNYGNFRFFMPRIV